MEELPIEKCNCEKIPERLHRNGRDEDHNFNNDEKIFRRFSKLDPAGADNILSDGRVSASIFDVDAMSCNRERFSESPEDTLFDAWCKKDVSDCGIVESTVGIIENVSFQHPDQDRIFYPKLKHNSEVCLFPHVEVVIMVGNAEVEKVKPQTIKLGIRSHYQNCFANIIKQPA